VNQFEEARKYLRSCGIDHPDPDVDLMAAFCAGQPLKNAIGSPPPTLNQPQELKFRRMVARRGEKREPIAYLVGNQEFMGLEFKITPSVLIPRPSTESLVERAALHQPRTFLEIGTGSGAISIVLARGGAKGTATDVSARALEVAQHNARLHGVEDRITFVEADLFVAHGTFDMVISNPPYVATREMATLQPEVKHEPKLALEAGADGLDVIRRIVAGARGRAPRLLLEFGSTQAAAVVDLALQAGWRRVRTYKDLDGFDRVLEAS